jgi:hypothetical protein
VHAGRARPPKEPTRSAGLSKLSSVTTNNVEVDVISRRAPLGRLEAIVSPPDSSPQGAYRGRRPNKQSACWSKSSSIPRKEVIQPQLPLRLPCYDFTPVTNPTFGGCLPRKG